MSQQDNTEMAKYFYRTSAADFMKIPGNPIAYWVGEKTLRALDKTIKLGEISDARMGLATGNNAKYVRAWHEISKNNLGLGHESRDAAKKSQLRWFPYAKGGPFRKWYGNNDYVVDWKEDGHELQSTMHPSGTRIWAHNFNLDHIFEDSITWSDITSGYLSVRLNDSGFLFDGSGTCAFFRKKDEKLAALGLLNTQFSKEFSKVLNPTMHFQTGDFRNMPFSKGLLASAYTGTVENLVIKTKADWDCYEVSWDFSRLHLLSLTDNQPTSKLTYQKLRNHWREITQEILRLEVENNRLFIEAYGLQDELAPDVPLEEITLTCNPHYRYGGNKSDEELETMLQCDTMEELVSYAIGCMMGRYSLDKPGLILASQGETLQDYLRQIPSPGFTPDGDAILPLTDQEWFADDATNRFREFIRVVWGDEHLAENLDFVAESLCLHAIKPKKGEDSLDTIRRYLSSQFYKDHLRTYKKRPIYWLFSSGKHKAFECLVYLHRYNEGSLARMRTEYVIPLTAKLNSHANKLEKDIDASSSTAEKKALEKQLTTLHNQQAELATFDEKLRHFADQRIRLDLDDGVKVNYGKFGDLLAEVNAITGDSQ